MTTNNIAILSTHQIEPAKNIERFINEMRQTSVGVLDWTADSWPKFRFFKHIDGKPSDQRMSPEFVEFMKAYFIHRRTYNPGMKFSHDGAMLRALESVLIQLNGDAKIHKCNMIALDETALLLRKSYTHGVAYVYVRRLIALATFLSNRRMVNGPLKNWKSPISPPDHDNISVSAAGDKHRKDKLPNIFALDALGEIFSNRPDHPRDNLTTSFIALLLCAPSRGNEILALTAGAEIESESNEVSQYGWRFYSSKGYGPNIKWIPSIMVPLAKEAFSRMLALSKEARELASWLESGEEKFFRHANCPDVSDSTPLSTSQAAQALGFTIKDVSRSRTFMSDKKLKASNGAYTLNSLWSIVKKDVPPGFPWLDEKKGVRYRDCIFSMLKHQFSDHAYTCPVIIKKLTLDVCASDLSPPNGIFLRNGYVFEDGFNLSLRSHQPRHLLNTLAQRGGISNYDLAKWSGRTSIKSNRVYNHITDEEIIKRIVELGMIDDSSSPDAVQIKNPITEEDFSNRIFPAVHVTEFGYCTHDFLISPCTKYRDCINCTEQVCVKGLAGNYERLLTRLERLQQVLKLALSGQEAGDYGADRWVTHHQKTISRLLELISMLDDPEISKGAVIRLQGDDFTQLSRVLKNIKPSESIQNGKTPKK